MNNINIFGLGKTVIFPAGGVLKDLAGKQIPFVMVDRLGIIIFVNDIFLKSFGWNSDQLIGKTLDLVLPEAFRMSHHLAFSNFNSSHESQVVGHPLILKTRCSDGSEIDSEHYIMAEREGDDWFFGASLKPL